MNHKLQMLQEERKQLKARELKLQQRMVRDIIEKERGIRSAIVHGGLRGVGLDPCCHRSHRSPEHQMGAYHAPETLLPRSVLGARFGSERHGSEMGFEQGRTHMLSLTFLPFTSILCT